MLSYRSYQLSYHYCDSFFAKCRKLEPGDNILRTLSSTTVI